MILEIHAKKMASLLCCTALLSGCGNDTHATRGVDTIKEIAHLAKSRLSNQEVAAAPAPDPVALIDGVLEKYPNTPLYFVFQEKTNAFAVSSIYGSNGTHVTWVSPDRKTMTLDRGMLVATRGLGSDLMSVQDDGAAVLISQRKAGHVTKTHRYLNREDQISRLDLECEIEPGGFDRVDSGAISVQTQMVTESCSAASGFNVKNSYWIDDAGRMVQSVQWVGEIVGKLVFRRLQY
jgi:hypothetical protein